MAQQLHHRLVVMVVLVVEAVGITPPLALAGLAILHQLLHRKEVMVAQALLEQAVAVAEQLEQVVLL